MIIMLVEFGADLKRSGNRITVKPGRDLQGREILVPGDISSAAFFIVLASILPGGNITIQRVGMNPTRTGILDVMQSMGAAMSFENTGESGREPIADLTIKYRQLQATEVQGEMIPRLIDELPIIAVAATQARGVTRISDAGELRVKETDRIRAIVQELQKMGAAISEQPDGFSVKGPVKLRGATCSSHGDHRIAIALAIAGLIAEGKTVIYDAECIAISFPEFVSLVQEVCGETAIGISQ